MRQSRGSKQKGVEITNFESFSKWEKAEGRPNQRSGRPRVGKFQRVTDLVRKRLGDALGS